VNPTVTLINLIPPPLHNCPTKIKPDSVGDYGLLGFTFSQENKILNALLVRQLPSIPQTKVKKTSKTSFI
jgi:hypothetical protein